MPAQPTPTLYARRVVLATGIEGSGDWDVPAMIRDRLPRSLYAHTRWEIDFDALARQACRCAGRGRVGVRQRGDRAGARRARGAPLLSPSDAGQRECLSLGRDRRLPQARRRAARRRQVAVHPADPAHGAAAARRYPRARAAARRLPSARWLRLAVGRAVRRRRAHSRRGRRHARRRLRDRRNRLRHRSAPPPRARGARAPHRALVRPLRAARGAAARRSRAASLSRPGVRASPSASRATRLICATSTITHSVVWPASASAARASRA